MLALCAIIYTSSGSDALPDRYRELDEVGDADGHPGLHRAVRGDAGEDRHGTVNVPRRATERVRLPFQAEDIFQEAHIAAAVPALPRLHGHRVRLAPQGVQDDLRSLRRL